MPPTRLHCGFAALLGRPNVGKSTLLNELCGEKVAIVSPKPQTTRHRILAVLNRPKGQLALVDTPGLHQAKGFLNRAMVDTARQAATDVDLVLFLVDAARAAATQGRLGDEDRYAMAELARLKRPTLLVLTKIDLVPRPTLLPLIDRYRQEFPFLEIVPVSAIRRDGLEELLASVFAHLPESERMFEEDMLTDQTERLLAAEYVREQVILKTRAELPYSAAVTVDEFDESERVPRNPGRKKGLAGLIRIAATISVERESQKAIVIGKRGQMLKAIGTDARRALEGLFGTHVFLALRVKVDPDWSTGPDALRKAGYP